MFSQQREFEHVLIRLSWECDEPKSSAPQSWPSVLAGTNFSCDAAVDSPNNTTHTLHLLLCTHAGAQSLALLVCQNKV